MYNIMYVSCFLHALNSPHMRLYISVLAKASDIYPFRKAGPWAMKVACTDQKQIIMPLNCIARENHPILFY